MNRSEPRPTGATELVTNVPDHAGRVASAETVPVEHRGGSAAARREAVHRATADAAVGAAGSAPVLALRHERTHGILALALAGRFDAEAADRLRGQFPELVAMAHAELVLDCTHLAECGVDLARTIGDLRREVLARGASVDLVEVPDRVVVELGHVRRHVPTDGTADES